jgi:hypothetical protein
MIQVVYTILVMLLISKYTKDDGGVWFILIQSAFTAGVFTVRQLFPGFVDRAADLGSVKAARPIVFLSEPIAVFMIGVLYEKYRAQKASFDFIFPTLLALKAIECLAFSEVTGSNGFFVKSGTKADNA